MQIQVVSVTYRKQVSDGNYGTESAEVTLQATVDEEGEEVDSDLTVPFLLTEARRHVYAKLDESPSIAVRRALRASERVSA